MSSNREQFIDYVAKIYKINDNTKYLINFFLNKYNYVIYCARIAYFSSDI